jgi:hypothetical protein
MKWKFVSLESGWDLQIVTTESERDRFARYCKDQGIRYGLVRVDEHGVYGEGVCADCVHALAAGRERGPAR